MMTGEYCVVVGDVIGSQAIDDREGFHQRLKNAFTTVNNRHRGSLHAPFASLKGIDEIGGVLRTVRPVASIQRAITRQIHPTHIRLVAVVGTIDVNPASNRVAEMDGPAFARADAILSDIDAEDMTFRLSGKRPVLDALISDEINLLDMVRGAWTTRKMEIIRAYERMDTQAEVADDLGISTQAVSEHLREGRVDQILRIEERLDRSLQSYPEIDGDPADIPE